MHGRIIDLSLLVPSISWWSVWTLPYYVWLGYAQMIDSRRKEATRG